MNVDVENRGFVLPAALADHARRHLEDVLIHRGDVIQRVLIRLGGTDKSRGHNDMYCLMQVYMPNALTATVIEIGPHLRDVIDRATDRVGRLVAAYIRQAGRERRHAAGSADPALRQQAGALAGAERRGVARTPAAASQDGTGIRRPRSILKLPRSAGSWNSATSQSSKYSST